MRWPRIEVPLAGPLLLTVVTKLKDSSQRYLYPELITPVPSLFSRAILTIDKNTRLAIDVRYTFIFSNKEEIPNGSTLILTVPTYYNLITTTPAVRVSYPDFVDASPTAKLSNFFSSNKVQISNIGKLPKGSTFRVILNGMSNPDVGDVMDQWTGEVLYNEYSLIRHANFYSISLENPSTYSILQLKSLDIFPTNAATKARYAVTIQPKVKLSVGSEIQIQFPDQYKVIPSIPDCSIDGGMKTFTSCIQVLNSIVFTIDTDYDVSAGEITLIINSVLNPDRGLTDSFEIYTKYDGVILERTDPNDTTNRTVNIANKPNSITIVSTDFDPQNEGEISTYTVSFVPASNIDLNQEIIFFFPKTFDQILGNKLQCTVTSGLADKISCTRLTNRILHIDGISSYQTSPDRPITILISGIINANKLDNNVQPVGLGILIKGLTSLIDYTDSALSVESIKAPGWAFFFSFNSTNTYCRYVADYSLNFTAASSIPKLSSNGAVILDLPKQFNIGDQIISCISYTPQYGTALNCRIINNRLWITGNTNDYSGNLIIKARRIANPIDEVVSDNFIVSTYDGINKKVIERSYENLDPFYKTYTYPGPKIIVNNNQMITVMRGTQSDPIPMYIEGVAALNLTIKPVTTGINIIPYNVDIQIGQLIRYFRVSCPSDLSMGNYTIDWIIQGELVPPVYTPIKTTYVQVIQTTQLNVTIDSISDIPSGGTSMPVFFRIPKAPDIGFDILVNFKKQYQGITLSQKLLSFGAGVTEQMFKIYFTDIRAAAEEGLTTGSLDLQVAGVNKELYTMPFSSMSFKIITQDVIPPTISLVRINDIQKTYINVTVQSSEPCYVYYMVALQGTRTPPAGLMSTLGNVTQYLNITGATSVFSTGNSSNKSNSTNETIDYYAPSTKAAWYQAFIYDSLTTTFIIPNLNPQLSYTLFVSLQDRGSKYSQVSKTDFVTKDRDHASDVSVRLKQSYISPYDTNKYLSAIALVLSLEPDRVVQAKYDFTTKSRILQAFGTGLEAFTEVNSNTGTTVEKVTTTLAFNIISTINSELYPSPKVLGQMLNNKTIELSARVDNLDSTYIIPSTDFVKYLPSFVSIPAIYYFDYQQAVINTRFDNYGWLYAVAIEQDNPLRSTSEPTPLQISFGTDSQNLIVPHGVIEITDKYKFFYMFITGLKSETNYAIYVIGANAHPGYPDLMEDKFVRKLEFKTLKAPPGRLLYNFS